jgi:hypothetical protein
VRSSLRLRLRLRSRRIEVARHGALNMCDGSAMSFTYFLSAISSFIISIEIVGS